MDGLTIRPSIASDRPDLRRAVIELHDHERSLHPTRRPGAEMADDYLAWMLGRAAEKGAALVAEFDGAFAGFVAGWIETTQNIAETRESNRFGYVSDICVLSAFRGRRVASGLLEAMERHFLGAGVVRIRMWSLAANRAARIAYERSGYRAYEVVYEKLVEPGDL